MNLERAAEVNDKDKFSIREVSGQSEADFVISGGDKKSEKEINEEIKKEVYGKCWWLNEKWKEKGMPKEQIEVMVGENKITVYNFNSEIKFSERHEKETAEVLKDYLANDPELISEIGYILIDNNQESSLLGDEEKFPLNGNSLKVFRAIQLTPRGMRQDIPHRISSVSNFKGTFAHELSHLEINGQRKGAKNTKKINAWTEKYGWDYCHNHKDEWEVKELESSGKAWTNRKTGKVVLDSFTEKPELCLNDYARAGYEEDMCDSRVAYFYDPDLLKKVCAEKYEDAKNFSKEAIEGDNKMNVEMVFKKIPPEDIKLPELPQKEYTYYREKEEDGLD